jgi:transcriptional regulator with XRE-family HTH domain
MVGRTIRILRQDLGLRQYQLAEQAGIAAKTLHRIEVGKVQPSIRTLTRLALVLGVPTSRLLEHPAA